jgi:indolepyruvate ferredoxin oxidoreductase alpha subunit
MQEMQLSGNEAIAWAAKCAGVEVATGYPGLPCTSIIETLKNITTPEEMYVEWAGNEKIALEMAYGVAISGGRALTVQKMAGLNVCLDSLMVMNLLGTAGGLVLAVGDVPGSIFSGNEQDSRALGAFAEIPVLEPANSQEGFDFTEEAFLISERFGLPVILRFTKDFAREKGTVRVKDNRADRARVISDIKRSFAPAAKRIEAHRELHEKNKQIGSYFSGTGLNRVEGDGHKAVITSGNAYTKIKKVMEAQKVGNGTKLLKIGALNPLPERFICENLKDVKEALVIEEIEPYLEEKIQNIVSRKGLSTKIYGKTSGSVKWEGELAAKPIQLSLEWFLGSERESPIDFSKVESAAAGNELPGFCEKCPYEYYFTELKKYLQDKNIPKPVFTGEPGCSIYLEAPPYEMLNVKVSLGSSIAVACGLAKRQKDREVVAIVGDSAFFHSEITSLIYASYNQANIIAMIVLNYTAAVTGRQPHPASGYDLRGNKKAAMDIAKLVEACQIPYLKVVCGRDEKELRAAFDQAFSRKGVRVIILDEACPLIR